MVVTVCSDGIGCMQVGDLDLERPSIISYNKH